MSQVSPSAEEKPVQSEDKSIIFPPFPDPQENDFEEDIVKEERDFYKHKFEDLNRVVSHRLHCTACDRHLGCSTRNESRMRTHPMLRTLMCHTCHTFYNSGEFDKGEDGSELYCRWCGQGGQVYCCSDCPHVFCAKCIKRNLGASKIKEIESLDDWKCFKCNPKCLWDLRALCWALLRYCDQRNKIIYNTEDVELKEKYQKDCAIDHSSCCTDKRRRNVSGVKRKQDAKEKKVEVKKERKSEIKAEDSIISKIPPTIQVKKFASLFPENKNEKKTPKRSATPPKSKPVLVKNPIAIAPYIKPMNMFPNQLKKIKFPTSIMQPADNRNKKNFIPYPPRVIRPRAPPPLYNGYSQFNPMVMGDNINLSLESLTQGLDMAAVAAMNENNMKDNLNNDVVCTPDFPLEPMCEMYEENDDDVQCITPVTALGTAGTGTGSSTGSGARAGTGPGAGPGLGSGTGPGAGSGTGPGAGSGTGPGAGSGTGPGPGGRGKARLPELLAPDNIVQMTEHDVTVNAATGGLKFRVDPQTLSANKMYRLPDGRIFAINPNPAMPGGYSATIVAVSEGATPGPGPTQRLAPKGAVYSAKVSAVPPLTRLPPARRSTAAASTSTSTPRPRRARAAAASTSTPNVLLAPTPAPAQTNDASVEWFRFNLLDAVDSLQYSLKRLLKLKKEATTESLRTRSLPEMRRLHGSLERVLTVSSARLAEVKENLDKGMKEYAASKHGAPLSDESDDDDVEILNVNDDDPIFIDENSLDSTPAAVTAATAAAAKSDDAHVSLLDSSDSTDQAHTDLGQNSIAQTNGTLDENTNNDVTATNVASDNEETSVPDNEETSVPDNEETSVPENEVTSVPDNEETSVPDNEETSVPDNEETDVPDNEETAVPDNEETSVADDEVTSVADKQNRVEKDNHDSSETFTNEDSELNSTTVDQSKMSVDDTTDDKDDTTIDRSKVDNDKVDSEDDTSKDEQKKSADTTRKDGEEEENLSNLNSESIEEEKCVDEKDKQQNSNKDGDKNDNLTVKNTSLKETSEVTDQNNSDSNIQDTEMSDEFIESLLKDDTGFDDAKAQEIAALDTDVIV